MDIREKARPKDTLYNNIAKLLQNWAPYNNIGIFQFMFLMNSGLLDWMVERKVFGQSMRGV